MRAAVGPLHRPRVDWVGESRNLHQSLWLSFVPTHGLSRGFCFESRQVFKTCPTIYKNDAYYSVFTSISLSQGNPERRKMKGKNQDQCFLLPPTPPPLPCPIQDQHSPRGSSTITFTVCLVPISCR